MIFILPVPPSINHYYGTMRSGQKYIKPAGVAFRKEVAALLFQRIYKMTGRVKIDIRVHFKDKRKRDIDNVIKSLLDALTHAGAWDDDSQIDDLHIMRGEVIKNGKVIIDICEISDRF